MSYLTAYSAQYSNEMYRILVFATTRTGAKSTALRGFKLLEYFPKYKNVRIIKIKDKDKVSRLISELQSFDKKQYDADDDFFVAEFEGEI